MLNKFKVGDIVLVIKLDTYLAEEAYDSIGEDYKTTLFKKGVVESTNVGRNEDRYNITFYHLSAPYDNWYFSEDEIIIYDDSINMETIKLLYDKKV